MAAVNCKSYIDRCSNEKKKVMMFNVCTFAIIFFNHVYAICVMRMTVEASFVIIIKQVYP